MGNKNNKAKAEEYGGVYFQLHQPVIVPNETVAGTVYLNVKKNYPADDLFFRIYGYEKTHFVVLVRHGKNGGHRRVHKRETKTFIDSSIKIYDWIGNGYVPPGQYSFPFQFLMPDGLPGSFFFCRGESYGQIGYELSAYVKPTPKDIPQLEYKFLAQIREAIPTNIQTQEVTLDKTIRTCCCIGNGNIKMKTFFEKNSYAPEETCNVAFDIDCSQAQIDMTNVSFNLTQSVYLQARGREQHIPILIASKDFGPISKGEKWTDSKRKFASIKIPPQDSPNPEEFDQGDDQEGESNPYFSDGSAQVTNESTITPTANGHLVKSNFHLVLTAKVDGCICCDNPPYTSLPIHIYAGELKIDNAMIFFLLKQT